MGRHSPQYTVKRDGTFLWRGECIGTLTRRSTGTRWHDVVWTFKPKSPDEECIVADARNRAVAAVVQRMRGKVSMPTALIDRLTDAQKTALLIDECAVEQLPFRDRDHIIMLRLARRASPQLTGDATWRTWLTPLGLSIRNHLARARKEGER